MSLDRSSVPIYSRHTIDGLEPGNVPESGALLLVDKPSDWTSFDVVAKTRNLLRVRKVGHTGTLDPMATGLLIICLGRATKLADQIQAEEKQYTGTIHFGGTTPTDDAESPENAQFPTDHLTGEMIAQAAAGMVGEQLQRPPAYSARKVDGKRMYALARRGVEVEVAPRAITITKFDITRVAVPDVDFDIECSKGTYIRALARDLGSALQSGAYLTALRRVRNGAFSVDDAVTIDTLRSLAERRSESPA